MPSRSSFVERRKKALQFFIRNSPQSRYESVICEQIWSAALHGNRPAGQLADESDGEDWGTHRRREAVRVASKRDCMIVRNCDRFFSIGEREGGLQIAATFVTAMLVQCVRSGDTHRLRGPAEASHWDDESMAISEVFPELVLRSRCPKLALGATGVRLRSPVLFAVQRESQKPLAARSCRQWHPLFDGDKPLATFRHPSFALPGLGPNLFAQWSLSSVALVNCVPAAAALRSSSASRCDRPARLPERSSSDRARPPSESVFRWEKD